MFEKLFTAIISISVIISTPAYSQVPIILSGSISGIYSGGLYSVLDSVVVDQKSVLTFPQGTRIRFEKGAYLRIAGTLICKGSPTEPIVFTSSTDSSFSKERPSPGHWKGIYVDGPIGDVLLDYVKISYSNSGIVVNYPRQKLNIRATIFAANKGRNLSVDNRNIHIEENYPFTFESLDSASFIINSAKSQKTGNSSSYKPLKQSNSRLRISSGITGAVGLVALAGGVYGMVHFNDMYNSASNPANTDRYRSRIVQSRIGAIAGAVLTLGGSIGFVLSF